MEWEVGGANCVSNQRGTVLVEGLGAVSLLALFLIVLLTMGYLSFQKAQIKHSLYEANICQAEQVHKLLCRQELIEKVDKNLMFGQTLWAEVGADSYRFYSKLSWSLTDVPLIEYLDLNFHLKDQIVRSSVEP